MAKLSQCGARTKKGARCKNPGRAETSGLCARHSRGVEAAGSPLVEDKPLRTRFERIERGAKFVGGITLGVAGLIIVIEFVHNHWPQIHHLFQYIGLTGNVIAFSDVRVMVERGTVSPHQLAWSFELWFYRLPDYVQADAEREFGDIKAMIISVRGSY